MSILDSIQKAFVPIHREGWRFIAMFAAVTLVLFWLHLGVLAWAGVIATLWCAYFFRDPERVTPLRAGLVISPADGCISAIEQVIPPPELDLPREPITRISVFMNVFDVHVNRAPVDATIRRIAYVPGKFVNAELDKASEDNERQALTLDMADGRSLGVVQIAGLIARRIVKFVNDGDHLAAALMCICPRAAARSPASGSAPLPVKPCSPTSLRARASAWPGAADGPRAA